MFCFSDSCLKELSRRIESLERKFVDGTESAVTRNVAKTASIINRHFLAFMSKKPNLTEAIVLCLENTRIVRGAEDLYSIKTFHTLFEMEIRQEQFRLFQKENECEASLTMKRSQLPELERSLEFKKRELAEAESEQGNCWKLRREADRFRDRAREIDERGFFAAAVAFLKAAVQGNLLFYFIFKQDYKNASL